MLHGKARKLMALLLCLTVVLSSALTTAFATVDESGNPVQSGPGDDVAITSTDTPTTDGSNGTNTGEEIVTTTDDFNLAVQKAVEKQTIEDTMAAIDVITTIKELKAENIENFLENVKLVAELIDKDVNPVTQLEMREMLSIALVMLFETTHNLLIYETMNKYVLTLPEGEIRTELAGRIDDTNAIIIDEIKHGNASEDGTIPQSWIDELSPDDFYDYTPSEDSGEEDTDDNNIGDTPQLNQKVDYKSEGGVCYQITMSYDQDGNFVGTSKTKATGVLISFCAVDNSPVVYEMGNNHSGSGGGKPESENSDNDTATPSLSTKTLQYNLDKYNVESPFVDTDIFVSSDGMVTYEEVKDVMRQLSVALHGKFVDDSDKFLILIEGKIIVVNDTNALIPASSLQKLFDDFTSTIMALETRTGESLSVQDTIQLRGISTVTINGTETKLNGELKLNGAYVVFPLKAFAEAIGATCTEDSGVTTITYNGHTAVYTDGSKLVKIDGQDAEMKVTAVSQDGVLYAQVEDMIRQFGDSMVWDAKLSKIIIEK